jgi:3-hydroxybutyryl-CoA dehydrogenase
VNERLGIAGSGTIACGLAAVASTCMDVIVWARSEQSSARAGTRVEKACSRLADRGADPSRVRFVTDIAALMDATYLVEAIVEDHGSKSALLSDLGELAKHEAPDAILATTTSSLSIGELARASGHPERFVGLHVFNPVPRMQLVELVFTAMASEQTRERTRELCRALGKTGVEVPDLPGFVVNRLLFPYLFTAVELLVATGLEASAVDQCMTLGAAMPMGPIALLDFVGLDVAEAIGEQIGVPVPERVSELVREGALGRKVGRGFYAYEA